MLDGLGWGVGVLSESLLSYIYTIPGQASSIKRVYFVVGWDCPFLNEDKLQCIQLLQI